MSGLENIIQQPWVLIFLFFIVGVILTRFLPDVWAFGLAGFFLAGHFVPPENLSTFLTACALGLTAYLTGNSFPWRRLTIVRSKMYKLFFSVALSYGSAILLISLLCWQFGWLEFLRPWLIYFTLAFGLISYHEPWKKMLSLSTRGPLSLVLQHLGALSSFAVLTVLTFSAGFVPALHGLTVSLIFFGLWLIFIRLAKLSPRSLLGFGVQIGFLFWLAISNNLSLAAGALTLGLANALTGTKVLDSRYKLDLWKILTALVFLLIFSTQKLEFTWLTLATAVLLWVLRFLIFYLYNLFARVYAFGDDLVRRINFGLQINDCRLIFNVYILCPLILPAALLVLLAEQLLYPQLLKRILVQSGETEG